jgi:hypothetical protein
MHVLITWAIAPAEKFFIEGMCIEHDEAAFVKLGANYYQVYTRNFLLPWKVAGDRQRLRPKLAVIIYQR